MVTLRSPILRSLQRITQYDFEDLDMSDQSSGDDMGDFLLFGSELSDREIYSIGKIVSLWGALEHEIFWQTYDSFNPTSLDQLPKEMNNQQSSRVLELWKKHVVDKAKGKRQVVLQAIYEKLQSSYASQKRYCAWDVGLVGF
jgi:hypothetical protein